MRYVSKDEFATAKDHGRVGVYENYDGSRPEWQGRRTIMTGEDGPGTNLYIEGVSFEIVENDDPRCPKEFLIVFSLESSTVIERRCKWFKTKQEAEEWAESNKPLRTCTYNVSRVESRKVIQSTQSSTSTSTKKSM